MKGTGQEDEDILVGKMRSLRLGIELSVALRFERCSVTSTRTEIDPTDL